MISTDSFIVASRILDSHKLVGYLTMSNDGTLVYMDLDTFKKYVMAEKFKDVIYDKKSKRPRGTSTPLNKYPSMQYSKVKSHMNQSRPVDTKQISQKSVDRKQNKNQSKTKQVKTLQNREKAERYLAKCNLTGRYELQLNVRSKDRVEVIGVNKNLETITIPDFVTDFRYKISSNKTYIDSWCKGAKFTKFVWNNISYTGKTIGLFSGLSQKTLDIQISHPEKIKNLDFMFYSNVQLLEISGLENLSNIEQMKYTFKDCRSLKSFDFVRNWNTSRVKQMNSCFYEQSLKSFSYLSDWDVSNVADMTEMFYNNKLIMQQKGLEHWNTKSLRIAKGMFQCCTRLVDTEMLRTLDFTNVEDIREILQGCTDLRDLKAFTKLKMPKVTQLERVFRGCYSLRNLDDLRYLDVQNIEDLTDTFSSCKNLRSLQGLRSWNTQKVRCMQGIFSTDNLIDSLDGLENFDTQNVENLEYAFAYCANLSDLRAIQNWNTGNVTQTSSMFMLCQSLQNLKPLKNWDVRKLVRAELMFADCGDLTNLDGLDDWKTYQLEVTTYMFRNCHLVSLAGMKNWDLQKLRKCKFMLDTDMNIYDYPEILEKVKKLYI